MVTFDCACFILGITPDTGTKLIHARDFPQRDGHGYPISAIDAWISSHGGIIPDITNSYTDRSRVDTTPPRRPWAALDSTLKHALAAPPPDRRAYYIGDGVPRDASGNPYEPLDWKALG